MKCCILIFFLAVVWNCKKEPKEEVCNEVIHSFKPPLFTAEQEQIIDKYRDIVYSKLQHPSRHYIYSVKERSDKTYMFSFFQLSSLQRYFSSYKSKSCVVIMGLGADVWLILNESGEIINSSEHRHPFEKHIFK
jgi:hypothetical protein